MNQDSGKPFAFILMPFDQEFDVIYERLIQPSLASENYEVRRADSNLDQQNIVRTIIHSIATADLIIAELTTPNPNVFYELGIAHALGKPVVLVSQGVQGIPFDLRSYYTISYSTRFDETQAFQDSLRELARQKKDGTLVFGNPVTDFAPDQVTTFTRRGDTELSGAGTEEARNPDEENELKHGDGEEEEPLGILDFTHTAETSMNQIADSSENLTNLVERFGQNLTARSAEVESAGRNNTPGSSAQMMKIVKGMSSDMREFSESVNRELPDFHSAWEELENSFTNLLATIDITDADDREAAIELQNQLETLQEELQQTLAGAEEANNAFEPLKGVNKDLNTSIKRVEKTLNRVFEEFSTGESVLVRTINLLDQKIVGS